MVEAAGKTSVDLGGLDLVDRLFAEFRDDLFDPDLNTSKVAVMLLAEYEDVVAQGLEASGGVPHILRHLNAFANLVLALVEELLRGLMRSNLLAFKHSIFHFQARAPRDP